MTGNFPRAPDLRGGVYIYNSANMPVMWINSNVDLTVEVEGFHMLALDRGKKRKRETSSEKEKEKEKEKEEEEEEEKKE